MKEIILKTLINNDPNIWNEKKGLFGKNENYKIIIQHKEYEKPIYIKLYNEKDYELYIMEYMNKYVYYYKKLDKNTMYVKVCDVA